MAAAPSCCTLEDSLVLTILTIGAIMCRGRSQSRVARSAIRRTRRPQAGAFLTVILLGTRLERREDGRSHVSALGGRDGDQPVTGGARGSARAAARRAPAGAKAELPVRLQRESRGRSAPAPPSETRPSHHPPGRTSPREINAPSGARRALRALEDLGKVLTDGRARQGSALSDSA